VRRHGSSRARATAASPRLELACGRRLLDHHITPCGEIDLHKQQRRWQPARTGCVALHEQFTSVVDCTLQGTGSPPKAANVCRVPTWWVKLLLRPHATLGLLTQSKPSVPNGSGEHECMRVASASGEADCSTRRLDHTTAAHTAMCRRGESRWPSPLERRKRHLIGCSRSRQ
jgi:hypothetical protein